MKIRFYLSILLILCLNLCWAQNSSTSGEKSTITKASAKSSRSGRKERHLNNVNNPKKENLGVGLKENKVTVLDDTIKNLKDSLSTLNDVLKQLDADIRKLKTQNQSLNRQIDLLNKKEVTNDNKRGWGSLIEKIYLISKLALLTFILIIFYLLFTKKVNIAKLLHRFRSLPPSENIPPAPTSSRQNLSIKTANIEPSHLPRKINEHTANGDSNTEYNVQKSFSNFYNQQKGIVEKRNNWFVVAGSSIGKSHISNNKPCQDNHYCSIIKDGWGIAVSCDGAGSAENSHLGSEFTARSAFEIFKNHIESFISKGKLPSEEKWREISNRSFKEIYISLKDFSTSQNVEFSSIACTVIVVVFTPIGLLSAHIGDGRAGYRSESGEWKSLIIPHKGEESNQTIFITSPGWIGTSDFIMSGVPVPESRVITERVAAFTLMSDGCESHSFDCSKMDATTNKWIDPNLPSEKFFNPLYKQLKSMAENGVSLDEANSNWMKFIEGGVEGLQKESDDKTLIFGILI